MTLQGQSLPLLPVAGVVLLGMMGRVLPVAVRVGGQMVGVGVVGVVVLMGEGDAVARGGLVGAGGPRRLAGLPGMTHQPWRGTTLTYYTT